jgi:hypothetical protein
MKFISAITKAFLAGLLEGDGYLGPVQLKLCLKDKDIVEYVADLLETNIRTIPPQRQNNKILYETSLGRRVDRETLYMDLYRWFGERRRFQIRDALLGYPTIFFAQAVQIEFEYLPQIGEQPSAYTPSAQEWAYLSGYFLAEGSISFDRRNKQLQEYDRPSLHLSSTDQDVIAYCAKLTATSYSKVRRKTVANKSVFVLNVTNFEKLQGILRNILPFISVSARHKNKVEKAIQEMNKRIEAQRTSSRQKNIRLNLQKELETFEPKGAPNVDWEELASIFQEHKFLYFVDVGGMYGISKNVRLRIKSPNFQMVEKVAQVFGNKVKLIQRSKKTHQPIYETQLEKKKYVFWILKNVSPFLSGDSLVQVEKALNFFKSDELPAVVKYPESSSEGKDEHDQTPDSLL